MNKPPRYENTNPPPPYDRNWRTSLPRDMEWINYIEDIEDQNTRYDRTIRRENCNHKMGLVILSAAFLLMGFIIVLAIASALL